MEYDSNVTMSADKYYTAVYLKVIYADAKGVIKKHYHRIENTKLTHYFLAEQVPRTYQDPVWRKLRDICKARCNKVVFRNYKFVGDPSTENFYLRHLIDALKGISVNKENDTTNVYEIRAKMYPWSDLCDLDTLAKDEMNAAEAELEEIAVEEIPIAI